MALLSVGVLNAQATTCPPPAASTYISALSSPTSGMAVGIALLALMVSFVVVGMGYIINKLMPSAGINRWLQQEYKEIAKTAILIVIIFSVIAIVSSLALALTGVSGGTGYASNLGTLTYQSELYLCNASANITTGLSNLVFLQLGYGLMSSTSISYPGFPIPPVPIPVAPWIPVFRSGVEFRLLQNPFLAVDVSPGTQPSLMTEIITLIYFPLVNLYTVQITILPFLISIGILVLIPMGLILRALPLVRNLGGTLVALGLLLALIWPSVLVLFNAPVSSYFYNVLNLQTVTSTASCTSFKLLTPICSAFSSLYQVVFAASSAIPAGGTLLTVATAPSFTIPLSSFFSIYPSLNYVLAWTIYPIFLLFFLLIFDLLIAYTITDNVAKLLGGSVRLSIGKLKLI